MHPPIARLNPIVNLGPGRARASAATALGASSAAMAASRALLIMIGWIALAPALCGSIVLRIDQVTPKADDPLSHCSCAYTFSANTGVETTEMGVEEEELQEEMTARFVVSFSPGTVEFNERVSAFRYWVLVQPRAPAAGPTLRFTVWGHPEGDFPDQWARPTVWVVEDDVAESTTLKLPIYSMGKHNDMIPPGYSKPQPLDLSGQQSISLLLTNRLALPVTVSLSQSTTQARSRLWSTDRLTVEGADTVKIPANDRSTAIAMLLTPQTGEAFLTALFPGERDQAHDNIGVTLSYATLPGQWRQLLFSVPVRFHAPLTLLCLLACGGGILAGSSRGPRFGRRFAWRVADADRHLRDLRSGRRCGLGTCLRGRRTRAASLECVAPRQAGR